MAGADLVVYTVAAAAQTKDSPRHDMVQWTLTVLQRRLAVAKLQCAQLLAMPGRLRTASWAKARRVHR